MSKHETKARNSCFISSHLRLPVPQTFLELSRSVEPAAQRIPGIRYAVDEAEAEGCPQEESLRTVLINLGIPEAKLQGSLSNFPGVGWGSLGSAAKNEKSSNSPRSVPANLRSSCAVSEIKFSGRRDLGGALHPQIAELTRLWSLDLDDTDVSGSLEVLANNTGLSWLKLRHTRVTGRLEDLPLKAKDLRNLDLTGTEVTGDVAALANFRRLLYLRLSNTAVSGELKSLTKMKDLKELDLSETAVSGELQSLAEMKDLEKLDLSETGVSGELKSLAQLERLEKLDLSNTAVFGELKSLVKLTELTKLDLSETAVSGELKSLEKLKDLKELDLANLKVGGDVAVMAEWSKIEHIDISGTQAEFDLFQQFEPFSWTLDWQCPLPALRFLDVSRTSRFSQGQDLLRHFAGCEKLATLKAAGCGLSGPLWPQILEMFGDTIPMNEWPLSQALSVLDFSRNNVTDVVKLPGSCRTLVLTGNPHVSFGAGVMEKAIQDMVFIDLRNATFGNPSDALPKIGQLAAVTHVLRSIVVPAVASYAKSISRTDSSQNFQISSERMVCIFVEKSRLIKVGQVRFDTKRCATRF